MNYATKNYSTGDRMVIGGELEILPTAIVIQNGKTVELVDKSYVDKEIKKLREELKAK
ncbi:hypothetical protein [Paenibacillus alvei]|uniref:hypothetical protein n=1 Tax=Paenibacillus alvei TaxID=44250 RepID=UPI002280F939|nr:hypothetical protein [Paenibacillus alvei]MCY7484427.1 hypothetical protein [Paenibacillus alvei]